MGGRSRAGRSRMPKMEMTASEALPMVGNAMAAWLNPIPRNTTAKKHLKTEPALISCASTSRPPYQKEMA